MNKDKLQEILAGLDALQDQVSSFLMEQLDGEPDLGGVRDELLEAHVHVIRATETVERLLGLEEEP